jgi:hypothetical protein
MAITTSLFIWRIETAKIFKKSAILGSNLTDLVGPCGAKNQKMVLTNVVQDAILYLKMNYQHMGS